jgi:hypothetical protein
MKGRCAAVRRSATTTMVRRRRDGLASIGGIRRPRRAVIVIVIVSARRTGTDAIIGMGRTMSRRLVVTMAGQGTIGRIGIRG